MKKDATMKIDIYYLIFTCRWIEKLCWFLTLPRSLGLAGAGEIGNCLLAFVFEAALLCEIYSNDCSHWTCYVCYGKYLVFIIFRDDFSNLENYDKLAYLLYLWPFYRWIFVPNFIRGSKNLNKKNFNLPLSPSINDCSYFILSPCRILYTN